MNPSPPTAHRRSCNLNRDQRLEVLKLHDAGHGPIYISKQLGITRRQVKYTIYRGHVSPQKSKGRPPKLTSEQVDELEAFIVASSTNRRMSYLELAMQFSQWNVGEGAIKGALARRGYIRYRARNLLDNSEGDHCKNIQIDKIENEGKPDTD
ncbi:hypothetical protein HI914_02760 [Erysiphe necator]|nr:hypothetical protein HI914_02760 [Erysiphe necator]